MLRLSDFGGWTRAADFCLRVKELPPSHRRPFVALLEKQETTRLPANPSGAFGQAVGLDGTSATRTSPRDPFAAVWF